MKQKTITLLAATLGIWLVLGSTGAFAGSILLTGHDTDDHRASSFMNWGLTALLNNGDGTVIPSAPTASIGFLGNRSASLSSYLGNYNNFQFYDLDNASWTDAFSDGNDVLVIGSGSDFVSGTGSATLNAESAAFTSYFNGGGNLFVNTHQGLGSSFYGFIPSVGGVNASNLTTCTQETGSGTCMTPTAAGLTSGLALSDIVQANITHNQFSPDPVFTSLEEYVPTGNAITIGLFQGVISGGGGFGSGGTSTIPEPGTIILLGTGLIGLAGFKYKHRKETV